jgi:hypothetical protein
MKSARRLLLAWMPPTLAAAMKMNSGFSRRRKSAVAAWFSKSSSPRLRISTFE